MQTIELQRNLLMMQRILWPASSLLLAAAALGVANPAQAQSLLFDQDVTPDVIFGSGNANGAFTIDQSNGIELGLRGKLRFDASNSPQNIFNSNGDGTYSFDAILPPTGFGFAPRSKTPIWSFEWSVNSDYEGTTGAVLNAFDYQLDIDFDAGIGTDFLTLDPINDLTNADHALGDNSTGNGGGVSDRASYATNVAIQNVAQNSWNIAFFQADPRFASFDPTQDGTYDFVLTAFEKGTDTELAKTKIQIIAGAGADDDTQPVPEPAAALALLGFGLVMAKTVRRQPN
jgi:hypothetical protein